VKEPNTLESETGKRKIFVVKKGEKPIQFDHCSGEVDRLWALCPEFLKEILVPFLGNRAVGYTSFVNSPEREVAVLLRKMAEQFLNFFARRYRRLPIID